MYMADSLNGLKIFNMTNLYNSVTPPENIPVENQSNFGQLIGQINCVGDSDDIALTSDQQYAVIANGYTSIYVANIIDKTNPTFQT